MPGELVVREARLADAPALFETHCDSVRTLCAGAYTTAQLAVWFEGRSAEIYRAAIQAGRIWLAERGGVVLGFVGFVPGEVTLLFVRGEAAGVGLGKRLFALGVAKAAANWEGPLTVVATRNALPFYAAQGFTAVAVNSVVRGQTEVHFEVIEMQRPQPSEPVAR